MNKGLKLKYFVLKPEGDDDYARASRAAMSAYSMSIRKKNPQLADELVDWVSQELNASYKRLDNGDAAGELK